MKYISLLLLLILPNIAVSADIASVNFEAVKDLLIEYHLGKPENSEKKKIYHEAIEGEKAYQEQIQNSMKDGKMTIDISKFASNNFVDRYEIEKDLEKDLRLEIYKIIKDLGESYDFIYDSSNADVIFYSKSDIEDITQKIRQAILDKKKK